MNYRFAKEHTKNLQWKLSNRKRAAKHSKVALDEFRGKPLPKESMQVKLTGGIIKKQRPINPLLKRKQ